VGNPPKKVHFLDFKNLPADKALGDPFPIPKISMVLQELEGFSYATALDLNMGYYSIRVDQDTSKICTIIFPWGKYTPTRD
jgi:hypothetical protein